MKVVRLFAALGLVLFCILTIVGQTQAPEAVIGVEAISPQEISDNGWPTPPYYPSSGLKNVGKGELVYLNGQEASGEEVTSFAWSILSAPTGSQTTLDSSDTQMTTFTPDSIGAYQIGLSITTASGIADTNVTITAATYVGVGSIGGLIPDVSKGQCAVCHTTNEAGWKMTRHASKFQRDIDGGVSFTGSAYQERCLRCHTVGFDENPTADNGGFDDIARELGWVLQETLEPGNFDSLVTNFPSLAHVSNIQCEKCHGPGSEHKGDKTKIDISLDEGVCGQCHESAPYHTKNIQWKNSAHSEGVSFASTRTPCNACHSGYGYIDRIDTDKDKGPREEIFGNPQISCVVCHDPHSLKNPEQLRIVQDVTLNNGEVVNFGGRGRFCMSCHLSRHNAEDYVAEFAVGERFRGPHGSIQTDMLAATNAVTFGKSIPSGSHRNAVEDLCIGCHMHDTPASGEPGHDRLGEHSFAVHDPVDNVDNVSACLPCHTISSFDAFESDFDYDRDGNIETIREELGGLLDDVARLLPPFGETDVVVDTTVFPKEIYTPLVLGAAYNHAFVLDDGSRGMHNFAFAVNLLAVTRDTLLNVTSVEESDLVAIPKQYALLQNYPNPFNPTTTIQFEIANTGPVDLIIYDVLGREVKKVIDGQDLSVGRHRVTVDAQGMASGVYYYRIRANDFISVKKMIVMK
jgi:hypothetical protein